MDRGEADATWPSGHFDAAVVGRSKGIAEAPQSHRGGEIGQFFLDLLDAQLEAFNVIHFTCPECGVRLQRPESAVRVACPDCGAEFGVKEEPQFTCPFCGTHEWPVHRRRTSRVALVFAILVGIGSLVAPPISCAGLLVAALLLLIEDQYTECEECGIRLG